MTGYCWPQSALPGESVELFCSASTGHLDVEVIRQGREDETVHAARGLPRTQHPLPEDAGAGGSLDRVLKKPRSSGPEARGRRPELEAPCQASEQHKSRRAGI